VKSVGNVVGHNAVSQPLPSSVKLHFSFPYFGRE
jgi:hypothetical protein